MDRRRLQAQKKREEERLVAGNSKEDENDDPDIPLDIDSDQEAEKRQDARDAARKAFVAVFLFLFYCSVRKSGLDTSRSGKSALPLTPGQLARNERLIANTGVISCKIWMTTPSETATSFSPTGLYVPFTLQGLDGCA